MPCLSHLFGAKAHFWPGSLGRRPATGSGTPTATTSDTNVSTARPDSWWPGGGSRWSSACEPSAIPASSG